MKPTTIIGTQLPLTVVPQFETLTGADFDFNVRFFTMLGAYTKTVARDDMTALDDGAFLAVLDTKFFTPGELTALVSALIPYDDAPGGYLRQQVCVHTGIELRRAPR